ncbi:hypothetical protein NUACC21_37480 [Scytonema sp. NUACC21]
MNFGQQFLLLATPAIATSMLATSPSQAATFAHSVAEFNINGFSISPLGVQTLTDTTTEAISDGGQVSANADATANFIADGTNSSLTSASNSSVSQAQGQGYNYIGKGASIAAIFGYNFKVQAGEKFSFDFNGLLNLETSIDDPNTELATADGLLSLELYDSTNGSLLDFFTIAGNLQTPGNDVFKIQQSSNIVFAPNQIDIDKSTDGIQEYARASFNGTYSRIFKESTLVTLVEVKRNQVRVQVPECSSILSSLFSCTVLGVTWIRKRQKSSSAALLVGNEER